MPRKITTWIAAILFLGLPALLHAATAEVDLSHWKRLPVLHQGRIMPLDTFAREAVEKICHRESPTLKVVDAVPEDELSSEEMSSALEVIPDEEGRKFQAAELLLSWLVEPEKWEHIPFLLAKHEELRELLEVPLRNAKGTPLQFVSPAQLDQAEAMQDFLREMERKQSQAMARGETPKFTELENKAKDLVQSYNLYRAITFQPLSPAAPRARFLTKWRATSEAWRELSSELHAMKFMQSGESELDQLSSQVQQSLSDITTIVQESFGRFPVAEVEPQVVQLVSATHRLREHFGERRDQLGEAAQNLGWSPAMRKNAQGLLNQLAVHSRKLAQHAQEMHLGLYDNGDGLRVTPALNAAALERERDISDDAQPWLALQAVLYASSDLLAEYPRDALQAVRQNFASVARIYRERDGQDRSEQLREALARLEQSLRNLGTTIEPLRRELDIQEQDEALIAYTAYPGPDATQAELAYNRVDPFQWSWVISLSAVFALALAFGAARRPMTWLGILLMLAGLVWTAYGFYLRVLVTSWAPVTNMYETVIYVPFFVSMLALWFTLLPLTWDGLRLGWRLSAIPGTWEDQPVSAEQEAQSSSARRIGQVLLLLPRAGLSALLFYVLTMAPYAAGDREIIQLAPRGLGGEGLDSNGLMTWAAGIVVLVPTVWYLPRAILSLLVSLFTVPVTLRRGTGDRLNRVLERWPFAFAGAFVAFGGSFIAWYSPVLDESFTPLQPVLRDNFWLTIHVLTIVSSYGAGALAWGLGNLALGYYLFGKYVTVGGSDSPTSTEATIRRPPPQTVALASYVYKSMQVAVLLLAAGTILGGLWADVSWGRFWGWDPKEVWALVSLLVYLAILHGRYVGWFGNFGIAAGAVMGASAIVFSWYGVNFVLGAGLHSYGFGDGGQNEVGGAVALNWLFLLAAGARYVTTVKDREVEPSSGGDQSSATTAPRESGVASRLEAGA